VLVVTRHRLPLPGYPTTPEALDAARDLLAVLAGLPGYVRGWIARAVDEPDLLVLTTEWEDVGSYRRALSAYEVKLRWPFLQTADDEATAFEVLVSRTPDAVVENPSARGADADEVGLGHAAAPHVSRGDFA
jgi:hypothetical protein